MLQIGYKYILVTPKEHYICKPTALIMIVSYICIPQEKFKNELKKRTFCIRWWKYHGSPLVSGCPSLRTQLDSDDSNPTNLLETKPMIKREWTIQISAFSES